MSTVDSHKDPSRFSLQYERSTKDKIALGIDLGTNCGYSYAIVRPNGSWEFNPWFMGLWDLSTGRFDTGNIGFLRLRQFLHAVQPDIVWYEDVKFTPSEAITKYNAHKILARAATSSEFLGALKQTLCLWCEDNNIPCSGIPIGTIKRTATGKGNANKADMITACNQKFGTNFDIETYQTTGADNVCDAAWVMYSGLQEHGNALIGIRTGEIVMRDCDGKKK